MIIMDEKVGYIPIFRKFFDHYLWDEEREFSKAEAWIDCIQMARYKKSKKKKLIAGNLIEWGYGQFPASIRYLRNRWGWGSNSKVTNFLSMLESDDMVKVSNEQGQNIITLCNYDTYDIKNGYSKDTKKTPSEQGKDTGKTDKGQNSKKGNKDNKGNISPLISEYKKLQKMEEPLTVEEGESLIEKYGRVNVEDVLLSMENWKGIEKKNKSTNLTAQTWLRKDAKKKKESDQPLPPYLTNKLN